MRNRWWAVPLVAGATALIAACGSSSPGTTSTHSPGAGASASPPSGATGATVMIMTEKTSKGTVLATAQGRTIYWFAIDTSSKSNCNGSCATYWPPVIGDPAAASGTTGLTMGFGTVKRADGSIQATYDGHPLYTYMGDTATGQISGNDKNLSGGLWWAMTPNGSKLSSSSGSSGGSGGGGY